MLVLSRRAQESIIFPTIETKIQLLSLHGNSARIGIDAPKKLPVLRGELFDPTVEHPNDLDPQGRRKQVHDLRNVLNMASMGIGLADRLLDLGQTGEARSTLKSVLRDITLLTEQATPAPAPKKLFRTLLVEDDANERRLLAGFLRVNGIDVSTANDGEQALDVLQNMSALPDIVLMDMLMPNCDGPTAIRRIRSTPQLSNVRIFGVSGEPADAFPLATPGDIDGWFRKPLDPERLVGEIVRAVETSAA